MLAALLSLHVKSVYACTYFPPSPWFNENVNLLDSNLPEEILIKQDGHTVSLTNNQDTSSFYFKSYNELKELGKSVRYSSYDNVLSVNGYYVTSLDPRNTEEDNRPADVKLPEPQNTRVVIILNQKSYNLQFKINYEINQDYMPNRLRASDSSCESLSLFDLGYMFIFSPIPIIIIAVLILIVIILSMKYFKAADK